MGTREHMGLYLASRQNIEYNDVFLGGQNFSDLRVILLRSDSTYDFLCRKGVPPGAAKDLAKDIDQLIAAAKAETTGQKSKARQTLLDTTAPMEPSSDWVTARKQGEENRNEAASGAAQGVMQNTQDAPQPHASTSLSSGEQFIHTMRIDAAIGRSRRPQTASGIPVNSEQTRGTKKAAQSATSRKKLVTPPPEQFPEPPLGFTWPSEKFVKSVWKGKHGGVINFIRKTSWAELLCGKYLVTMQMIKSVDPEAWTALHNYCRGGRKIPEDIKILSDHAVAKGLRQGLLHAQLA